MCSVGRESKSNISKPQAKDSCVERNPYVRQPMSVLHYMHSLSGRKKSCDRMDICKPEGFEILYDGKL